MQEKLTYFQKKIIVKAFTLQMRIRKHTQVEAARACGVDQPLVHRILHFDFDRLSPRIERACDYAKINRIILYEQQPRANEELIRAVSRLWDGTSRGDKMLRRLLRAVETSVLEHQALGLDT